MRTTITLDDDVAAAVARRRAERGTRLREEINELLRAGLSTTSRPAAEDESYELPTYDPGRRLIADDRAMKSLLDDEDVERGLLRRA